MPINFPTTGLTAGVTTYTYSGNNWIWNGFAWDSVVTPGSVGLTAYVRTWNGQTGDVGFSNYVAGVTGTANQISVSGFTGSVTIGLSNNVNVVGNLSVGGNLTVSGGVTSTFSETVLIEDNFITLNSNVTGGSPSENAGVEVSRGASANVQVRWNESTDRWQFTNDGTSYWDLPTSVVNSWNGQTGDVGFSNYVSSFGGLTGTVGAGLTSTQVLFWNANSVTGSNNFTFDGTDVVTLADTGHYSGRLLGPVLVAVKNTSGGTLTKGTPVYATGSLGASGIVEVAGCSASDSSKMPSIGLLDDTLIDQAEGHAVVFGNLRGVATDGYTINGTVFVAPNGGLTGTKPTGANDLIQNIGRVIRVHASSGDILVSAIGRSNDVPNIVQVRSYLQMPDGTTASSLVKSWNGQTGAVTYTTPLATSSVTGVASFGNEFQVSALGAVSLTANYVKSVNGFTGAVVNIAVTGANTFTGLQTMNAGITANNLWVTQGATFASRASFNVGITANNLYVSGGATFGGPNFVAFTTGLSAAYVYANTGLLATSIFPPQGTELTIAGSGGEVANIGDYGGNGNLNYIRVDDINSAIDINNGNGTITIGDAQAAYNGTTIQVNDASASIALNGFVQTNQAVSVAGSVEVASGGVAGSGTELNYTRTALTTTGANQTIWQKSVGDPTAIPFSANYRSAELFVQATKGATFESFKMIVGHTNVDTYNTEYAVVRSGPVLGTYTTTLVDVSTDRFLRLRVTPSLTGTTFMVYSTLLPT